MATPAKIKREVRKLLDECRISAPPIHIDAVAEACKVTIHYHPLESDLSGFLYRDGGGTVIGVNSHHARVRQRFTIAHELGHYLLHQGSSLHVDRLVFARLRSSLSSQGVDREEIEANQFAAAMLMPEEFIARALEAAETSDLLDEGFIGRLAKRFEVSAQAMLLRLIRLGYVEQ